MIVLFSIALLLSACHSSAPPSSREPREQNAGGPVLELVEAGVLTAVTAGNAKPASYVEGGQLTGLTVELTREIAKRLGLRVDFRLVDSIEAAELSVSLDQADLYSGSVIPPSPLRNQKFLITQPVNYGSWAYLAERAKGYRSEEDLQGRLIGTIASGTQRAYAETKFPIDRLKSFNNNTAQLTALVAGQLDAILIGGSFVRDYLERYPHLEVVHRLPVPNPGGLLMRKSAPQLVQATNKLLDAMYADCTYIRLWERFYIGESVSPNLIEVHPEIRNCKSPAVE